MTVSTSLGGARGTFRSLTHTSSELFLPAAP